MPRADVAILCSWREKVRKFAIMSRCSPSQPSGRRNDGIGEGSAPLARKIRQLQLLFDDDRVGLMHVGRSSVPFCWVGRGAPHQAVILLDTCWVAGCTAVSVANDRLGAGSAASDIVSCQYCRLNNLGSEVRFPSAQWYAMFGSINSLLLPCKSEWHHPLRHASRCGKREAIVLLISSLN